MIRSLLLLLIMSTGISERIRVEINKGENTADEIFKKNNCCLANHRDTPQKTFNDSSGRRNLGTA